MKRNQNKDVAPISNYLYENIFNTYQDEDGRWFYNLYNTVQFSGDIASNYYTEHSFAVGDYWTKLAVQYYGNMELWWVICTVNGIINPFDLPEPGTKIKILNAEVVGEIISNVQLDG